MTALFLRLGAALALVFALALPILSAEERGEVVEISRFSGKPVPRFESLRYSAVHGRQGPNLDHPILWRYEREGLPMLIIRETYGWARVRDPDGDEVWMQARMLSEQRTVLVTQEVDLSREPEAGAEARAKLQAGVIATLEMCEVGWCEIEVDRQKGWVPADTLWGTEIATGKV